MAIVVVVVVEVVIVVAKLKNPWGLTVDIAVVVVDKLAT